jgi:hypothetical protein
MDQWVAQLRALGFDAEAWPAHNMVVFGFTIPVGKLLGQQIRIGIVVPQDSLTPPTGIHVSPQLLPLHSDQSVGHPIGGVHPAGGLGEDWQYWSRPFERWLASTRDACAYMAHVRHLFATL